VEAETALGEPEPARYRPTADVRVHAANLSMCVACPFRLFYRHANRRDT